MIEPVLTTQGLVHRFGGVTAVDNVSLACRIGEIHALIGPNGAGKTTLINLISGQLRPDAGKTYFCGKDITNLKPHQISRRGIARSFQKSNVFLSFTVFENCRLAAQSRMQHSMHFFLRPEICHEVNEAAHAALTSVGLSARTDAFAGELSHGERRQLEVAMTLATAPKLLLLDEPLAGMGADESAQMVELLCKLARGFAILVIEHDVDAVFAMANVLTVMVNGTVLASGTPTSIRTDPKVQSAYLGISGVGIG